MKSAFEAIKILLTKTLEEQTNYKVCYMQFMKGIVCIPLAYFNYETCIREEKIMFIMLSNGDKVWCKGERIDLV